MDIEEISPSGRLENFAMVAVRACECGAWSVMLGDALSRQMNPWPGRVSHGFTRLTIHGRGEPIKIWGELASSS